MKRHKNLTVVLTVLFITIGISRGIIAQAGGISENTLTEGIAEVWEDSTSMPVEMEEDTENVGEPDSETQRPAVVSKELDGGTQMLTVTSEEPAEPPAFQAKVEWSNQGWIVKGCFQDMTTDTILVQPMCSIDGEIYDDCGQAWSLEWISSEEEGVQEKVRNQRCLFANEEPFKSYLAKDLDRFFIKLRIVRKGGITLETQAAVIERKEMQPEPAEVEFIAKFAPCVLVREGRPPTMRYYGRYQMTVREDATVEEIAASLPDTLPVEVGVYREADIVGSDIVDCPVRWKALEPAQLTAGESVTLLDAAEEMVVPAGTVLHTQTGIYRMEEPLPLYQYGNMTDEVRLILNVVAKDGQPEGALAEENYGLEIAFSLKPTGAKAIRAYFFREGDTAWTEIESFSMTNMVNSQPATANSGYAVVLGKEQDPLRSYYQAVEAGEEPTPFCVGVKVEGGVFDGGQLVLAWPDTYKRPLQLPQMGGAGGNEGNAGSDDKDDGTEEGQRPGLPGEEPDQPLPEEPDASLNQQPPKPSKKKQSKPQEEKLIESSAEGISELPKEELSEPLKEPEAASPEEQPYEPLKEPSGALKEQPPEPLKEPSGAPKKQMEELSEEKEYQVPAAENGEPAETQTNFPVAVMAVLLAGGAVARRTADRKKMEKR